MRSRARRIVCPSCGKPAYEVNQLCFEGLVRNIENQNELGLDGSYIRTNILDIRSWKSKIDWTKTKS